MGKDLEMKKNEKDDHKKSFPEELDEEPTVYAIKKEGKGFKLSRRSFLGAMGAGATFFLKTNLTRAEKIQVGESDKNFIAHTYGVISVQFGPDIKMLASGSSDNTIKLWSLPDGKLLKTLKEHSAVVSSVALSPDGKKLASGSRERKINL